MIDLLDQPYHPGALCECGDPECLGAAEVVNAVVADLTAALPTLQSPLLKLKKERDEARRLAVLLGEAMVDIASLKTPKAVEEASLQQHHAIMELCKKKVMWDPRSYAKEDAK